MLNRTRRNPVLALAAAALLALGLRPPAALADHHLEGCGVEREACILRAIDTLAPGAPGQWTKGGKPKVGAIEAVAGIDITAAERDRAWSKYAGWKEQRHALEELRGALAEAESERDGYKEDAARRQAEVDDMGVSIGRMDRARRAAEARAASAERRAVMAESKTGSLLLGTPVCAAERAVVQADDSWRAKTLRAKADRLLRCLAAGEGVARRSPSRVRTFGAAVD